MEPGLSDVFARYATDHLLSDIDELGTRDGSNLTVEGYDFAPSFSNWTTIEECLNPPVIWEADRGWLGPRMRGKTCTGLRVTGIGADGNPRSTYLYHVVDNEWSMAEYGHQCVVWQTAVNPVVALELLAGGTWNGTGVFGPEAFDAVPFLDLLSAYGSPWVRKNWPSSPRADRSTAGVAAGRGRNAATVRRGRATAIRAIR